MVNCKTKIGREIMIFSNKILRKINREAGKYGLTAVQSRVLGFIYHNSNKKDIFQKDIEVELQIRRSSVTSVLQLMEKNGYIKRIRVSEDGRLKKIILTDKGTEIQKKVYDCIINFENDLRNELSEEEFYMFIGIINRLSKKIDN